MAAFVKFSRGLKSAYTALSVKDQNTLYLVYDSQNSHTGELYLGEKLISNASSSGGSPVALADLSDVSLEGTISDGAILQFNASSGNSVWEAADLNEALPITYANDLNSILTPHSNDIAIVGNKVYIYHNNDWLPLGSASTEQRLDDLEDAIGKPADTTEQTPATGIYAELENYYTKTQTDSAIANAIAGVDHLRYEIVNNIAAIDTSASDAQYKIYLVPKSETETNNGYDEYLLINNILEKVGSWDVDPSTILTQEQQDKLNAITLDSNKNLTITSAQVSDLNTAIQNNQLIKSVESGVFDVTNGHLTLVGIPTTVLNPNDYLLRSEAGDLSILRELRKSTTSTFAEEILALKENLLWNPIPEENETP